VERSGKVSPLGAGCFEYRFLRVHRLAPFGSDRVQGTGWLHGSDRVQSAEHWLAPAEGFEQSWPCEEERARVPGSDRVLKGQSARGQKVLRDPDGAALRGACDPGRIALKGGIVVTVGKILKIVVLYSALSRTILSFWPSGLAPAREEYGAPLTLL
jgi:hypothetical protein